MPITPPIGKRAPIAQAPNVRQRPIPYFFSLADADNLRKILSRPYVWFIENGDYTAVQNTMFMLLGKRPDFAVNLTSATAYRHKLALILADALHHRFGIGMNKSMQVHTCLQEAILNAVIHGNFAIKSRFQTLLGFEEYLSQIEERLKEPYYASKRITIGVWRNEEYLKLAINDQGSGFDIDMPSKEGVAPHGSGLKMIHSIADTVWLGEDKNTLWIEFKMRNYEKNHG